MVPGRYLAQAYLNQSQIADYRPVHDKVQFSLTSREDLLIFPREISLLMNEFLQRSIVPILKQHNIGNVA